MATKSETGATKTPNTTTTCPKCKHPIGTHRNVMSYPDGPTHPGRVVRVVCTRKLGFSEDGTVERCGCSAPVSPLEE